MPINLVNFDNPIMMTKTPSMPNKYACILICMVFLVSCQKQQSQPQDASVRYDISVSGLSHDSASNDLYLWTENLGIARLSQKNQQWSTLNNGFKNAHISALVTASNTPNLRYAAGPGAGVYRSRDSGQSWTLSNKGLTNVLVNDIALNPASPDTLYASTLHGGVFKSSDGGDRWSAYNDGLENLDGMDTQEILLIPGTPATLLLRRDFGLYKKTADEAAWTPIAAFSGQHITDIVHEPNSHNIYVVAGEPGRDGQIYQSVGSSDQWLAFPKNVPERITTIGVSPQGKEIYVGLLDKGVLKSTDHGQTWAPINDGLPKQAEVSAITVDTRQPKRIYVGFRGRGVYVSDNGGDSWDTLNSGIPTGSGIDLGFMSRPSAEHLRNPTLRVPKEFRACNVCHGWADPYLNAPLPGRLLVTGTPRNWQHTVHRMNAQYQFVGEPLRDSLRPWEEAVVAEFLNQYFGTQP